jgi:16S rRNA (guanine527-N7)-methyltransferase
MSLVDDLLVGLNTLGLSLPEKSRDKLLAYLKLLEKWNKVYNLTAIREPERMLSQHLLDSLAVLPYIQGESILDVGSGGGLPGVPLAIALPGRNVVLLDSSQKKTTFLKQASIELQLPNISVVCDRVESWRPNRCFDIVISRAFSDLAQFARLAGHLCAPEGALLAMKGVNPHEEATQLPAGVKIERIIPLQVPQLEAQRHLVVMKVTTDG